MKRISFNSTRRALALMAWALTAASLFAGREVTGLRCEHRENPLGIDAVTPRLSWHINDDRRNAMQTAYQILVATSEVRLKEGAADLWDSGKFDSDQSVLVPYGGRPLGSHTECIWKVRVWDQAGRASAWSRPAKWTIGILHPDEWRAKWIGQEIPDRIVHLTEPSWIWFPAGDPAKSATPGTNYFRRVVTLPTDRQVRRAIFQYTGAYECRGWLDIYDLGARRGPGAVRYNDITARLEPGRSYVVGFTGRHLEAGKPAGIIGSLVIEFDRGEPMVINTDDQWKVTNGEAPGWLALNYDDANWVAPKVLGPAGMEPFGKTRTVEDRRQPARWLRKEFTVEKKVRRAMVYYSGLGLSEVYLNGVKVGDHVLSPALAQYDKRVFYVTFDVTSQIRSGANAIGAVLGGGRFYADRSNVYTGTQSFGPPQLLLHLRIEHADGTVSEVVSDGSWQLTTDGPIRANSEYDGEEYDARMELGGWCWPGALASAGGKGAGGRGTPTWRPAQVLTAPRGVVCAQMQEPIRVTGTLQPVKFTEPRPGVFVFDLGQNMVGWCRLKVSGPAGATIRLRHAETLKADGTLNLANLRGAKATDVYITKGQGREVYEPRFTYHGFRYVEMTGFPGRPTLASLAGRVVNDDLPVTGEFACSNELLNRIYHNIVWGTRGNYRSIPTDCPQRDERQGWLGDRSDGSRGESYLFNAVPLYAKWMQDICDAQCDSGRLPDVAPTTWPIYSDNVTWPSTLIIAPGGLWRQSGDPAAIGLIYEPAKKWVNYMNDQFATNHIIARDSYGDWCVPPEDLRLIHSKDPARQTDKALLATSHFYHDLNLMECYARLLGKPDDAAHFAQWAADVKTAFNNRFLDRGRGYYDNGSQTACVLPLAFGLVPEDMRASVFARLVDKIENETKGHIGTGLIGGQHLMRVLSDHGRADLVYTIATQKDYPGWGYMVEQGATTIWELWNGNTADPTMNSGNHVMLVGDLVIWFYEYLAGIAADPEQPGFKHIIMKPQPVGNLTYVKAKHRSPYGEIKSEWRKDGSQFIWEVEVPANTTATVTLPKGKLGRMTEGGKPVAQTTTIGSGQYRFVSE